MDQLLVRRGLAESRHKARAMIMAGQVSAGGLTIDKPGRSVPVDAEINVAPAGPPFVSRGGLKLDAALEAFSIDVAGKVILDVGASTGGFTDCLLQRGAARVLAVDVGYGQLDWKLRQDPRVRVLEKTNIRDLTPEALGEYAQGAVIDVSFISLRLVVPQVIRLLRPDRPFVAALVKPQFEVGRGQVGKGGVVRDPVLHRTVLEGLSAFFEEHGWWVRREIPSPILGPKGNREFLVHLEPGPPSDPSGDWDQDRPPARRP
ncbi:MAG: TlyA family RNA methyltransferase [Desulfobacteraceae bacterium]